MCFFKTWDMLSGRYVERKRVWEYLENKGMHISDITDMLKQTDLKMLSKCYIGYKWQRFWPMPNYYDIKPWVLTCFMRMYIYIYILLHIYCDLMYFSICMKLGHQASWNWQMANWENKTTFAVCVAWNPCRRRNLVIKSNGWNAQSPMNEDPGWICIHIQCIADHL